MIASKNAVILTAMTTAAPCPTAAIMTGSDHVIAKQAAAALYATPYLELRSITCEWRGGALALSGEVSSYFLKQVAQSTVSKTTGVGRVVNGLTVRRVGDSFPS